MPSSSNGFQYNPEDQQHPQLYRHRYEPSSDSMVFVIASVLVLVVGYVMRTFRPARDLYAIGSDPAAALLAGCRRAAGSSSPS